jgi:hypothetical protein
MNENLIETRIGNLRQRYIDETGELRPMPYHQERVMGNVRYYSATSEESGDTTTQTLDFLPSVLRNKLLGAPRRRTIRLFGTCGHCNRFWNIVNFYFKVDGYVTVCFRKNPAVINSLKP